MMRHYTWSEVIETQHNDKEAFFIPNRNERPNDLFVLKKIKLEDIPYENFTTLTYFEEADCLEDVDLILPLLRAYRKKEDVPPIIITKDFKIIDGFHRMAAQYELEFDEIEVFMQM